jgi:hypothetical protein
MRKNKKKHILPPCPYIGSPMTMPLFFLFLMQFRVDPSGLGFDLVIDVPLLIGTVPLANRNPYQVP